MATIAQKQLFGWEEIEDLGDLARLRLVLESLPDEDLMWKMERARGVGRNDYPVRVMWNSLLAGVVFGHESVESLRRELLRNAQLRQVCGFDVLRGAGAVPSSSAYTRFLKVLMRHEEEIEGLVDKVVKDLQEVLPDFGESLGVDSKGIHSYARRAPKDQEWDGRRDIDANWGLKTRWGLDKEGKLAERLRSWFGYKLHLIVETNYELPVAYEVTKASAGDCPQGRKLVQKLEERHPDLVGRCEVFTGDKA